MQTNMDYPEYDMYKTNFHGHEDQWLFDIDSRWKIHYGLYIPLLR